MVSKIQNAVLHLKHSDKVMGRLVREIGPCTLKTRTKHFDSLVRSIISQQISVGAARSILMKFREILHNEINPENVLALKKNQFKKAGISPQKNSYLLDLALHFSKKTIDTSKFRYLDNQKIIDELTKIRGVGRWTAEMFLIFSLRRLNVLPVDDWGFKRSIMINYSLDKMPSNEKVINISKKWEPYKSIATWYLWQSLNIKNGR